MGFYSEQVFPHVLDWALSRQVFQRERPLVLAPAFGNTLEIGFGTGLNLIHYPKSVSSLTTIEPHAYLPKRVRERIRRSMFPIHVVQGSAEKLPFDSSTFDCVVTTWTLCTIPNVLNALQEMRRVLKPNGIYLFLEHGRADCPTAAKIQNILNPLQQLLASGCHLNRPISALIRHTPFKIIHLERKLLNGGARFFGKMYMGLARKD